MKTLLTLILIAFAAPLLAQKLPPGPGPAPVPQPPPGCTSTTKICR